MVNLPEIPITVDDLPQVLTFYFKDEAGKDLIKENLLQIIAKNSGYTTVGEKLPNITATILREEVDRIDISVKIEEAKKFDWEDFSGIPF